MKLSKILIIALVSGFFCSQAFALSTDRDQPADIEADDVEFDFKQGIKTYKKNVLIVQGTLQIKADELITVDDEDGELSEATATGAPGTLARFRQRPDGKPDDVEGWAERIVVDQTNNIMTLYGKAGLKQGADIAQGETIVYNMATDTLKVQGGAKIGTAGTDGQAPTQRRLEDPFKDSPLPVAPVATQTAADPVTNQNSQSTTTQSLETESPEVVAPAPVVPTTVPSGRSRLIIQPKSQQ